MQSRVEMQVLVDLMGEAFALGKTFSFTPYGDSMLPTLQNGKDTITLAPDVHYAAGDIILFRRPSGKYVLHRIVGKLRGGFMLCGDNENVIEYPIFPKDIVAKVVSAEDANGQKINLHPQKWVRRLWYKKLKLIIKKILCSK